MPTVKCEDETEKYEFLDEAGGSDSALAKSNLKGDWLNFFLLLLLYTMQGLPLGISSSIPVLMQSKKNVSYQDQALFSLTGWPFSMKLMWAPLVDALWIQRIGRRKSWLIPVQYLLGTILFYMGSNIDDLMPETGKSNVVRLMYIFITSNFLAATQDIAVDGWALTMLKKNNVGYASTCNSLGQTIGVTIGSVVPILFTSQEFCNKYLRSTPAEGGVLTFKGFLYFCGILFITITTLIALFKKEKDCTSDDNHVKLNVFQNYTLLWDVLKLPSIRILVLAMLTAKIGFAAGDSVSTLKLIDAGISKDDISIIHTAITGLNMIMPLVIAKFTSGPKPMTVFLKVIPIRLPWNILFAIFIYYTPKLIQINGVVNIPIYYYAVLTFVLATQQILPYIMFIAVMAFFSRISDSRFGGTYMTLLNTVTNLGYAWTSTIALGMIDVLTFKECSLDPTNKCSSTDLQNTCNAAGGNCITVVNGYYVETALCTILGGIWYLIFKNIIENLQSKNPSHWLVDVQKSTTKNVITSNSIACI